MPNDDQQVQQRLRDLRDLAHEFENLMKHERAKMQTVHKLETGSSMAQIGRATFGLDYLGEKMPHGPESLEGSLGVDRILSMARDHIKWMEDNHVKTDLDPLGSLYGALQQAANAPTWVGIETRATSLRSVVPPLMQQQLLKLEQRAEQESKPSDEEDDEESRKRRWLQFVKKQEK